MDDQADPPPDRPPAESPTKRALEAALRSAGLTRRQAARFVRAGWPTLDAAGAGEPGLRELIDRLEAALLATDKPDA